MTTESLQPKELAALIRRALEECKGNRTLAAQKLGISRRTLHRKLREHPELGGT